MKTRMLMACAVVSALICSTADAGVPDVEVYGIQGTGMSSPHVGETVRVPSSVVTAVLADGFMLQTPDARADADSSLSSNGIRVFTGGAPVHAGGGAIAVGDLLDTTGTVAETNGETRLLTTAAPTRLGTAALPVSVEFSAAAGRPRERADNLYCLNGVSNFECYEGMRITLPNGVAASGNSAGPGDNYGPVAISPLGQRSLREKGVRFGGTLVEADNGLAGIWDGNPEVLKMDADRLGAVPAGTAIAGGAQFSGSGVLLVEQGTYTFAPQTLAIDAASNALPVPVAGGGAAAAFRIVSFDLGGLCDSNPANTPQPCASPEPTAGEVSTRVSRLAAYIVDVLGAPDVVAVQQAENQPVLAMLATAVATRAGGGATYAAALIEGNDPRGLDVGFLVRTDRIQQIALDAQLASAAWNDPVSGPGTLLHPQPPLLLTAAYTYNAGAARQEFRVLNVQLANRAGVDAGTAGARERRFAQAESIAQLVQTLQTHASATTQPLVVGGKLHGWNWTDAYVDVLGLLAGTYFNPENLLDVEPFNPVSPVLVDILKLVPPAQRITAGGSEAFGAIQGEAARTVAVAEALDHLLLSLPAQQIAISGAVGRGNADAPAIVRQLGTGAAGSSPYDAVLARFEPACRTQASTNQDGDAWCDTFDNCPSIANDDHLDFDGDDIGDACDADLDGDGVDNGTDNCPTVINPDQEDVDDNGVGNACDTDIDGDGVANAQDNCPNVANPQQEDFDHDGTGDACDPQADVALDLASSPAQVQAGQPLTVTASLSNAGPQTVPSLRLQLALPAQARWQSITPGAWTCDPVTPGTRGAVTECRLASLAVGTSVITVQTVVDEALVHGTELRSSGTVTPDDLNAANNADEALSTVIVADTDLRLVADGPSPLVRVNDRMQFLITLNNLGLRAAQSARFAVARPNGTELAAITPPAGWSCPAPAPGLAEIVCTTPSFAAGEQVTIQYTLAVDYRASGTQFTLAPTVSSSTTDSNMSNNSTSLQYTVEAVSNLIFRDSFSDPPS